MAKKKKADAVETEVVETETTEEEKLVVDKGEEAQLDLNRKIKGLGDITLKQLIDALMDDTKHTFHHFVDNYVRLDKKIMANLHDNFEEVTEADAVNLLKTEEIHAVLQDGTTDKMETEKDIRDIAFCCTYAKKIK